LIIVRTSAPCTDREKPFRCTGGSPAGDEAEFGVAPLRIAGTTDRQAPGGNPGAAPSGAEWDGGPRVSVIVPTYNRAHLLAHTLPTVLDQDFGGGFEVVVVVDGSTDGTAAFLRSAFAGQVRVLEQPNSGAGAARNLGAEAATGDILLFVDDDALCDRAMVRTHWEEHRRCPGTVVFGPVRMSDRSVRSLATEGWVRWTERYLARFAGGGEIRFPDDIWICTNTSLRRSDFLATGGFHPGLHPHEDTELAIRLWKRGLTFRYASAARAEYLYSKSAVGMVRDHRSYGETEVALCRLHPEYRAVSQLPRITRGPGWKRALRAALVASPLDPGIVALSLAALADRTAGTRAAPFGDRLMRSAAAALFVRSAGRAAGGWRKLRMEFGGAPHRGEA
jgi:GT2 family glycosyltransferase